MAKRPVIIENSATNPVASAPLPLVQSDWWVGLSDKQRAFVEHYAKFRNATQAYGAAYDTAANYSTRAVGGSRVANLPEIKLAVQKYVAAGAFVTSVDIGWLMERFLAIATADPRELIGLKIGACRYCWGDQHKYHWREREYLEALDQAERDARANPRAEVEMPDVGGGLDYVATRQPHPGCPQCHGEGVERFVPRDTDQLSDQAVLLYGGVKVKKDGYEIIIADQQKALEAVGRMMGAFKDAKGGLPGTVNIMQMGDLRGMDPADAARAYRDFIAGSMAG
jgi:phage terminase small subunit